MRGYHTGDLIRNEIRATFSLTAPRRTSSHNELGPHDHLSHKGSTVFRTNALATIAAAAANGGRFSLREEGEGDTCTDLNG